MRLTLCIFLLIAFQTQVKAQDSLVVNLEVIGLKKTLPWVIYLELPIHQGEKIHKEQLTPLLDQSKQNLYNLALFNEVKIDTTQKATQLFVKIQLKERWYIWGSPRIGTEERNSYDFLSALQRRNLDRLVYGGYLQWQNLTGRNEWLILDVKAGFSRKFKADFIRPYLFRKLRIDMATGYHFTLDKQAILGTAQGKVIWRGDNQSDFRRTQLAYLSLRKRFTPRLQLRAEINWQRFQYADTVLQGSEAQDLSSFLVHSTNQFQYPSLTFSFFRDERDIKTYPLKGYKYHIFGRYAGFSTNGGVNFGRMGFTWAHFLPLGRRWNFSYGLQYVNTIGKNLPWQDKIFLGTRKREFSGINHELRGYQAFLLVGTEQAMMKLEAKWAIFPYQTITLPFIPVKKLNQGPLGIYLTAWMDQAWLNDNSLTFADPTYLNQWLMAYGAGLNIIGFYDMLLRVEYGWNRMGQGGLYFQTTVQIK
ncbi:MAG: BamA/TamA family outer membrane protein [Bacteroidia bacterium]|nr:BamA/TamA family outer membrane protein [Bacteroidia bacterium]